MRHSRIELTMNYYTDPILLDVAGVMNSLPSVASCQNDSATRTAKGRRPTYWLTGDVIPCAGAPVAWG